jgi:hypothetical protein
MPMGNWVDTLVGQARSRGDFDDLPGKGKPIPNLDKPYSFVDAWVEREGVSEQLPDALGLLKEAKHRLGAILMLSTEAQVRTAVVALNTRIGDVNARLTSGPPSRVAPLDADDVVERWRAARRDG